MTEEIRKQINLIRNRVMELHHQLMSERERSNLLEIENNRVNQLIALKEAELNELNGRLNQVESENSELLNRLEELEKNESTDQTIDVLVKEIDFCIQQLKNSNE